MIYKQSVGFKVVQSAFILVDLDEDTRLVVRVVLVGPDESGRRSKDRGATSEQ
jgi:hypothetical protein